MKTIVTLTGPTCSGKTTLERGLVERGFASIRSTTSRTPRAGELEAQAYNFVTADEFVAQQKAGAFIEQVMFNGHHYGASKAECEAAFSQNKPVVIVVEPEGATQIHNTAKEMGWLHLSVFINISLDTQMCRFITRNRESIAGGKPPSVTSLLDRLDTMISLEYKWSRIQYDILVSHFDSNTQARVYELLINAVKE